MVRILYRTTLLAVTGAITPPAFAQTPNITEKEVLDAGVEAVVYGLPIVIMDITMKKTTNVSKPEGFSAPVNQFINVQAFPDANFKDIVRANVDTFYSTAWLDLTKEPWSYRFPTRMAATI